MNRKAVIALLGFIPLVVFAEEDSVVKIACGSCSLDLKIMVVEETTNRAIENVSVTFFDHFEARRKRRIEVLKGGTPVGAVSEMGTSSRTDEEGLASINATFGYSASTWKSGAVTESRWPQGEFRIEHPDFMPRLLNAKYLIGEGIDSFDEMKVIVHLKPNEAGW